MLAFKKGVSMKCSCCGEECFEDRYPEIVFVDNEGIVICENCSINFEEEDNGIVVRNDQ
jgi:hypothetical protein